MIRDTNGSLFAREQALFLASQELPTDKDLGPEDVQARRKVVSLHYLGRTERLFQILEELKPLADIAFEVGHKFFDREMIVDQLSFVRNSLNEIFLKEHGIICGEECLEAIPTNLPKKPLSQGQKKKQRQREKAKRLIQAQQEQMRLAQLETEVVKAVSPATSRKLPPLQRKEEVSRETFSDWYYRTQGIETKTNFKSEFIEVRKQLKAELKEQRAKSSAPVRREEPSKVEEKEEVQLNPTVKHVVHAPHKNGSKKLRSEHIKDIKKILLAAGYTPEAAKDLKIGGGPLKVFMAIHNEDFSGEMNSVTNMIRALQGHVDESRSGSRIGIVLRHIKTREIVGTDLLAPGDVRQEF